MCKDTRYVINCHTVASSGLDTDIFKTLYDTSKTSSESSSDSALYDIVHDYYTDYYFQIRFYDEYLESLESLSGSAVDDDDAVVVELSGSTSDAEAEETSCDDD